MSKASNQTITLLAVINGIFITIDDWKLAPELAPTVDWGMEICKECIEKFPETGNPQKNYKWMQNKLRESEEFLGTKAGNLYSSIVLSAIANHIITDLMERIKDPKKLELLIPIDEVVQGLNFQLDPKGSAFDAYEEADNHLSKLYKLLEF